MALDTIMLLKSYALLKKQPLQLLPHYHLLLVFIGYYCRSKVLYVYIKSFKQPLLSSVCVSQRMI